MGNLSGESHEINRKDKVTRFHSVRYARQLGLLVNTPVSHLKNNRILTVESNLHNLRAHMEKVTH